MVDNFFAWLLSLSRGQLLTLILGVVLFFVVVKLVKKTAKVILIVVAVVACLLYFGFVTPEDIKNSAEALADSFTSQEVVNISVISDSVQISDGVIEFNIGGTWYRVDDITRLRVNSEGFYLIEVQDSEIKVSDPDVQKLIDVLTSK